MRLALPREAELEVASLVREHSRFLFRVAYSVLRNAHDAEDAVQESFLKLARKGKLHEAKAEGLRDAKAYLAKVVWRTAVDRWRKPVMESLEALPAGFEFAAKDAPADDALMQQEQAKLLERLIGGLPAEFREVISLATVQELTSAEMARVLGVPEGTVRTRLLRARNLLKKRLRAVLGEGYVRS